MAPKQDTRPSYIIRAIGMSLKVCYGVCFVAFSAVIIGKDKFSKKRDEYRVRYGKERLRKTEERCS
jgi:hypothetical protein